MTPTQQFMTIVYRLAIAGRFADIVEFFALMREVLRLPSATIIPGKPQDKELGK